MSENIDKNLILKTVGQNVKNIRKAKGLTQDNLAEKLEKSVNFISLLEQGKTGAGMPTIIDICNSMEVDANSVFTGLLNYKMKEKDKYIVENISTFSDEDKQIVIDLIKYIMRKKEC